MGRKIVVIGGTACGPKAAARARRRDQDAEITIIERGPFVSYAGCGLPYYIAGVVEDLEGLMRNSYGSVRDVLYFGKVKNIKVMTRTQAVKIDRNKKTVTVKDLQKGGESGIPYDKLVLATGASPCKPPLPGADLENVFTLRAPRQAEEIRKKIEAGQADRMTIIGAGRIGLEVAEAFSNQAVDTTIVDIADQVLPGLLDPEMAKAVEKVLKGEKVELHLGEKVKALEGESGKVTKVVTENREIETDAVLLAAGVRPEAHLARDAGLDLGVTGAIAVDDHMGTSDPDILAGGDCVENLHLVTGQKVWVPLGSTANRHGRVIGDNLTGGDSAFPGIVGTGILRTLGANVGCSGITEEKARELGYDPVSCLVPSTDKSHFYPGGKDVLIKLTGDRKTGRLLGVQAVGSGDVVRRVDAVAAALRYKGTIADLADMDLCYAPPFGAAIEAVAHAANILRNKMEGLARTVTVGEVREILAAGEDALIIDVRSAPEIEAHGRIQAPGYVHVEMAELRHRLADLPRDKRTIVVCQAGQRSYEIFRVLSAAGFEKVEYMEGGMHMFNRTAE